MPALQRHLQNPAIPHDFLSAPNMSFIDSHMDLSLNPEKSIAQKISSSFSRICFAMCGLPLMWQKEVSLLVIVVCR